MKGEERPTENLVSRFRTKNFSEFPVLPTAVTKLYRKTENKCFKIAEQEKAK